LIYLKTKLLEKKEKINVIIKGKRRKMFRGRGYVCKEKYRQKIRGVM
jgi:hypothetical protein